MINIINRFYLRAKNLTKLNLGLLKYMLNKRCTVRKLVLRQYLFLSRIYINPFDKQFQKFLLKKRVSKSRFVHNKTHVETPFNEIKIVYINLESRSDRREQIETEFKNIGLKSYSRFEAISKEDGALGCVLSHIKVLEEWDIKQHKYLLICEDDVQFQSSIYEFANLTQHFIEDINLDVLCLGFNNYNQIEYNSLFYLTSNTQTTSCYLLKFHMRDIILSNFKSSAKLLESNIDRYFNIEMDQVWKLLQSKFMFVIPKNRFAIQRISFSNIANRITNYQV